jgi:PAS domain S-box-containing protein
MRTQDANERLPRWLRALPAAYLLVGLAWIVGSDVVLGLLLRHDLQALVYAGTLKGALFVILTAALLYIAIVNRRGPRTELAAAVAPLGRGKPLAAFLVVGLGIATAGYVVYLFEVTGLRDRSEEQLLVTAESTASEIELWREGRARALQQLAASPFTGPSLVEWRRNQSETLGNLLEERLTAVRLSNEFAGVAFTSLEGDLLMANGQPIDLSLPSIRAALANSVASDRVIELQTAASAAGRRRDEQIVYIVPLKSDRTPGGSAANVLVAQAGLEIPLRLSERNASSTFRTLRTILLRQDPQSAAHMDAVPLDGSPGEKNALASNDSGDGLATHAVTRERVIFEAVDAGHRRVLAASHRVADSPYFAVASIELDEIREQMLRVMLLIGGMSALGFLAAGVLVLPWWHVERMRSKGQLQEAHSRADELATRLDLVTRHANDVILLLDEDGRILDANDRALELYGCTREELLARSFVDLWPDIPAERQSARAQFEIVCRDGSLMFEATQQRKDGTTMPVEASSRCVTLNGQRFVQSIVRDISQRREAELRLRESEAQYRLLFQSNPHPMWVYDPQSLRFLAVNDAAIIQYGYGEHEFLAMTIADIRPSEDLPRLQADVRRHAGDVLQHAGVWRHRRKDGSIISVEIVSHSLQFAGRAARLVLATDVTARMMAEASLRASEERYRHLFEHASDGVLVLSSDNEIIDVNAEMEMLTGYTRDQLRGITLEQLLDAREHARLAQVTARLRSGVLPSPTTWLHRRRNGSTFNGEVRVRVLPGGSLLATVRDLTEILAARRRIERQRDLYDLLSQCNQAIVQTEDKPSLFNELCRLAVERGHFVFACVYEVGAGGVVVPTARYGDDHGYLPDALPGNEALRSRRPAVFNDFGSDSRFSEQREGESSRGIQAVAAFPFSEHGGATAALALYGSERGYFDPEICATLEEIAADVSHALDTLHTRRELEENRLLLQSIINASDAEIYAFDTEGRTILTNEAFARALGASRAALIGRTRDEMMPPDIARAHVANDQRVICSGRPLVVEERSIESGIERIYLAAKAPLRDVEGRIYAVGGISTDITELRRVQRQLADANVRLEEKVEERTREAVAARGRAEAADRAKSLFLSSMSHELRSPLHSIIGFTSVLLEGLEGDLTPVQQEHLRVVADASQHLLAIINDLLDVSRIESGAVLLASHPVAVREMLRRVMQRFRLQAESKGLELILEEDVGERVIIGDERRIEQVVSNLVSNGIKYTSQGRVLVRCGSGDSNLRIDVVDTGSGIALRDQSRLFRYFSQVAPASGRLNEGTGLGLAIARGLAEVMGGEVSLESEPGRGSTFTFILPARTDEAA